MSHTTLALLTAAAGALVAPTALAQAPSPVSREAVHRMRISEPTCLDRRDAGAQRPADASHETLAIGPCSDRLVVIGESAGETSDHIITDPEGRWWIRIDFDGMGRIERMWGRNAAGQYWIRREDLSREQLDAITPGSELE